MDVTLLLADAKSPERDNLAQFLCESGFRVDTASTARECLAKLRLSEPDMLVLDLDLPPGETSETVGLIHSRLFDPHAPVVLITGKVSSELLSLRSGMPKAFCFQKPIPRERLLDQLGLMVALIDLDRCREDRPRPYCPVVVPDKPLEVCLV